MKLQVGWQCENDAVNVRFRHRLTLIALALMVVVAIVAAVTR
ncbi:MAG: hypothetical protein V9G15_12015 [Dermatophilaceae bacterium]